MLTSFVQYCTEMGGHLYPCLVQSSEIGCPGNSTPFGQVTLSEADNKDAEGCLLTSFPHTLKKQLSNAFSGHTQGQLGALTTANNQYIGRAGYECKGERIKVVN